MRKIPTLSTLVSLLLFGVCVSERANARPSQPSPPIADSTSKADEALGKVKADALDQDFSRPVAQAFIQGSGMCAFAIVTGASEPATSSTFLSQRGSLRGTADGARRSPATCVVRGGFESARVFLFRDCGFRDIPGFFSKHCNLVTDVLRNPRIHSNLDALKTHREWFNCRYQESLNGESNSGAISLSTDFRQN